MRVVIKPAGLILILCMLGVLGALAYLRNQAPSAKTVSADTTTPTAATPAPAENQLINPGFEGETEPVLGTWPNSKGTATGDFAKGWLENSLWGNIKLEYAIDKEKPHGGSNSQRIKIVANDGGQVQFVQERPAIVGKTYEATVWVRASEKNMPVSLTLRQAGEPYKEYKKVEATVGTDWQKISVVASPTEPGNMYTMVTFRNVGATLWVDDANLVEIP